MPDAASRTAARPSPSFSAATTPLAWHPLAALRRRWTRWWHARLPLANSLLLTQRNVYIVPTGAGWMLALTLLVLLVAAINYQLNLGYLLTFLLAGSAVVGMHISHATLRGLSLHLNLPEPQFFGHSTVLTVQLTSTRRTPRHAIALAVHGSGQWAFTDVPAQGSASVQIAFAAPHRGRHSVPTLCAETRFPLGTFRVWSLWRPATQVLVYPAPEIPAPPLPPGEPRAGGTGSAPHQGMGEFDGVRAYRRGDPLQQVVWKKAAQALAAGTDNLVSRDTPQTQRHELWLTPERTGLQNPEARLSRLTAWVLQAERLGLQYGLRLPGLEIAQGSGLAQRQRCLEALALC